MAAQIHTRLCSTWPLNHSVRAAAMTNRNEIVPSSFAVPIPLHRLPEFVDYPQLLHAFARYSACHSIKLPQVGDQDYVTCSMVLWRLS
jgi:hypothetical protein